MQLSKAVNYEHLVSLAVFYLLGQDMKKRNSLVLLTSIAYDENDKPGVLY